MTFDNQGVVQSNGNLAFNEPVTQLNAGVLFGGTWHANGGTIAFPGNVTENQATIQLSGLGSISNLGSFLTTNGDDGILQLFGATLNLSNPLTNNGDLLVGAGSSLTVLPGLALSGFNQDVETALLTVDGVLNVEGFFVSAGTLAGSGFINASQQVDLQGGTTLEPGGVGTTGSLTFSNQTAFIENGIVNIQIGGTGPGQFDQVLGGFGAENNTLNLSVINGYTPSPAGDTFVIFEDFQQFGFEGFSGISEGSVLTIDGIDFIVSFVGGVGANDFTLTAIKNVISVTSLNDSGPGSLRQAILDSNASPGYTNTIDFSGISGTITLQSNLPAITDTVIIDGYTAPGSSPNTQLIGSDAVLTVVLDGSGINGGRVGLEISADNTVIRGLVMRGFGTDGSNGPGILDGINIRINSLASNVVIAGNHIGTDAAGAVGFGARHAILILGGSNHMIGGSTAADRNVISGNDGAISTFGTSDSVRIFNNYIGTDAQGTSDLGNGSSAIYLEGTATNYLIGGTGLHEGNLLSGNNGDGITLDGPGVTGNSIFNNIIGMNATGTAAILNDNDGIRFVGASNNVIGGIAPGSRNWISGNAFDGISIEEKPAIPDVSDAIASSFNVVEGNYIGTNLDGTAPVPELVQRYLQR